MADRLGEVSEDLDRLLGVQHEERGVGQVLLDQGEMLLDHLGDGLVPAGVDQEEVEPRLVAYRSPIVHPADHR